VSNSPHQKWNQIFEESRSFANGLHALLPDSEDLTLLALKGHLILEALLTRIVSVHFWDPAKLQKANLRFNQLVQIASGMVKLPYPTGVWGALRKLNEVRNAMAHNLEPRKVEEKLDELFILACGQQLKRDSNSQAPESASEKLAMAISSLIGALGVIDASNKLVEHHFCKIQTNEEDGSVNEGS
jgi:hypothetical protein